MSDPKTMTVDEFWKLGLVQEINRRLLHPMGLALSVTVEFNDEGEPAEATGFGVIYDSREDPEGFVFGEDHPACPEKAARVQELLDAKHLQRVAMFGHPVQPTGRPEK